MATDKACKIPRSTEKLLGGTATTAERVVSRGAPGAGAPNPDDLSASPT